MQMPYTYHEATWVSAMMNSSLDYTKKRLWNNVQASKKERRS